MAAILSRGRWLSKMLRSAPYYVTYTRSWVDTTQSLIDTKNEI